MLDLRLINKSLACKRRTDGEDRLCLSSLFTHVQQHLP
jgi:hypothetical protein